MLYKDSILSEYFTIRGEPMERDGEFMDRRKFLRKFAFFMAGGLCGINGLSRAFAADPALATPRIALIIDDIGFSRSRLRRFLDIGAPMTFAVLPRLGKSPALAEEIRAQGHEVMLHQPMEPFNHDIDPGPGALYVGDGADRILKVMEENISDVPFVTGINNHMGSRFTACRREMKEVLEVVKTRGLFFVDSLTTSHSTAYGTARMLSMAAARRNFFLDNHPDESYVLSQLQRLRRYARRTGHAIGIGHPFKETARAVESFFHVIGESDISMVHISSLIPA